MSRAGAKIWLASCPVEGAGTLMDAESALKVTPEPIFWCPDRLDLLKQAFV